MAEPSNIPPDGALAVLADAVLADRSDEAALSALLDRLKDADPDEGKAILLRLAYPPDEVVAWFGNLESDCTADWKTYHARARVRPPGNWHCVVVGPAAPGGEWVLLNTEEDGILVGHGHTARHLCEFVMRSFESRRRST